MRKYNVVYRKEVRKKLREGKDIRPTMSRLDKFKRFRGKGTWKTQLENEKRILMLKLD